MRVVLLADQYANPLAFHAKFVRHVKHRIQNRLALPTK
jgi:hypothetical protein